MWDVTIHFGSILFVSLPSTHPYQFPAPNLRKIKPKFKPNSPPNWVASNSGCSWSFPANSSRHSSGIIIGWQFGVFRSPENCSTHPPAVAVPRRGCKTIPPVRNVENGPRNFCTQESLNPQEGPSKGQASLDTRAHLTLPHEFRGRPNCSVRGMRLGWTNCPLSLVRNEAQVDQVSPESC
ncbi:unnamed protein product [Prunus armeniaca]